VFLQTSPSAWLLWLFKLLPIEYSGGQTLIKHSDNAFFFHGVSLLLVKRIKNKNPLTHG
jgi:hypothetical protein